MILIKEHLTLNNVHLMGFASPKYCQNRCLSDIFRNFEHIFVVFVVFRPYFCYIVYIFEQGKQFLI